MDPLSKGYVNWKDGMKISEKHFEHLQVTAEERLKDARAMDLEYFNYGILGSGADGKPPLELHIRIESRDTVFVEVIQCRGVTEAGDRVEVLARDEHESQATLSKSLKIQESDLKRDEPLLITIRVDNEAMQKYGQPDPEESPLRYPYAKPSLSLETLLPHADSRAVFRNNLVIARLLVSKGELSIDENFIPPCKSMRAHTDLRDFAFEYQEFQESIEEDLFKIIRNLGSKEQLTPLAKSVGDLSVNLINTLQLGIDDIKMFGPAFTPAHYVLNAKKMARSLRNSIDLLTNERKEELLNYIQEVIDIGHGEYTNVNVNLLELDYDHLSIYTALQTVLHFCKVNGKLFNEWSNLDYIGKKKKSGIFVGEVKKETEVTKEKKRWDF